MTIMEYFFYLLGLLGFARLWGGAIIDGTLAKLLKALSEGNSYVLPNTSTPIKTSFTGLPPIDFFLRFLIIFFWEAVDGSHPAATATGIYFLGQVFPLLTCIYMDSLRTAQGFKTLGISAHVFLYQMTGMGCTAFLWAISYTTSSPCASLTTPLETLQRASLTSPQLASVLLPAIAIGFALPGAIMGLSAPQLVSYDFQQWAIIVWNIFPINVFVALQVFGSLASLLSGRPNDKATTSKKEHLRAVRWVSGIALAVGFAMHVAVASISISSFLFPALFHSRFVPEFDPVFLTTTPLGFEGGNTVGDGLRSFFIWDQVFGYAFVVAVMLVQLRSALRFSEEYQFSWLKAGPICVLMSFLVGPGTVMMGISWLRDEVLFGAKAETVKGNLAVK